MAVNTPPDGFQIIPILATKDRNQLYAFLEQVFDTKLLDRQDTPGSEPAYMTVRIGDSVISVIEAARRSPAYS